MKLGRWSASLALVLVLSACSGTVKVDPAPASGNPTAPPNQSPVATSPWPNEIGAVREALGPGLVVTGYTALERARAEVRIDGKVVQSAEVSAKDGGPGYWSVTWPTVQAQNAEVYLINPADGSVLAKGAISPDLFVGLYHSALFADTRVDAKAADQSAVHVSGQARTGERIRVEFFDPQQKLLGTQVVQLNQGAFDAVLPWPAGANSIRFYTLGGKDTPTLGLIIQIVAR